MKRIAGFAAAAAACVALFLVAAGARAEACTTRETVRAWFAAHVPAARVTELAGAEARAFLAAFNARPPRTDFAGDAILLAETPAGSEAVRAVLFASGCVVRAGRMPKALVRELLAAVERQGA